MCSFLAAQTLCCVANKVRQHQCLASSSLHCSNLYASCAAKHHAYYAVPSHVVAHLTTYIQQHKDTSVGHHHFCILFEGCHCVLTQRGSMHRSTSSPDWIAALRTAVLALHKVWSRELLMLRFCCVNCALQHPRMLCRMNHTHLLVCIDVDSSAMVVQAASFADDLSRFACCVFHTSKQHQYLVSVAFTCSMHLPTC
jgi:hypothetical protein